MPNRIIKESIKRSPEIDGLSWFEEVVFYRLIVTADDYGRLDGRPIVLRNDLFPTKDTITKKAIEDAVSKLVSVGLLVSYVDAESNMPYLVFRTWEKHQTIRNKYSRYPAPPDGLIASRKRLQSNCKQTRAECCDESESESESNQNLNPYAHTREDAPPPPDTVEAYASGNLMYLSPTHMQELGTFKADLPDDVIRHGIDEACANGVRKWAYARKILQSYVDRGVKSVGDIKAGASRPTVSGHQSASASNPALNYMQREYDEDYTDALFKANDESIAMLLAEINAQPTETGGQYAEE